ncbi:MAG: right-handed parallel beta-helix repeat-containing protein, partial [Mariprofundaceae bacterium]|nr:right-handed parallel beta-helix repeat-containing protein [Mariprofundaceae bacterium]
LVVGGPAYRVSQNMIAYNAGNGILVSPAGEWPAKGQAEIVNNVVSSNAGYGIYIDGGARALVRENLVENNQIGVLTGKGVLELAHNTIVLNTGYALVLTEASRAKLSRNIIANNGQGVWVDADADLNSEENVVYGHILRSGFLLYDVNYIRQDWMPTLSGDEFQVKVMPADELRAPSDLNIDPGFVDLGADYRLRPESEVLKRFTTGRLPGAFPAIDAEASLADK